MKRIFINIEKKWVGKLSLQPFFEMMHRISLRGMYFNQSQNINYSGELYALVYANKKNVKSKVVFDVGANNGEWTKTAFNVFGNANYHLFEPSASLSRKLEKEFIDKSVVINNIGLSNCNGIMKLYNSGELIGTSYPTKESVEYEEFITETVDSYCELNNIDSIFYLKIDVEGNEFKVLEGCHSLLDKRKIDFIQFEYGPNHIVSRVFLKDFFEILGNYRFYRIVRGGLREVSYNEIIEIPLTSNYLAELK